MILRAAVVGSSRLDQFEGDPFVHDSIVEVNRIMLTVGSNFHPV